MIGEVGIDNELVCHQRNMVGAQYRRICCFNSRELAKEAGSARLERLIRPIHRGWRPPIGRLPLPDGPFTFNRLVSFSILLLWIRSSLDRCRILDGAFC